MKIVVAPNRSILFGVRHLMPGDDVIAVCGERLAQEHLRSGFAVVQEETAAAAPTKAAPVKPDLSSKKWGLDPDGLTGRTLEHLNLLVGERDPSMSPFETVEEAIAQLSSEFVPLAAPPSLPK